MHERFREAEGPSVTLAAVREQLKPLEDDTVCVSAIVPVKPSTPAMLTVELAVTPESTVSVAGLASTVKSCIVKITATEWDVPPLAPVTVTVYVPDEPLQERVELCDVLSEKLAGPSEHDRPAEGEIAELRLTVPVKPLALTALIVVFPAEPALRITFAGLAVSAKSCATNSTEAE